MKLGELNRKSDIGKTSSHYVISGDVSIDNPTLSIVGSLHPQTITRCLELEKKECNEGMWGRFLLLMPKPVFPLLEDFTVDTTTPSLERYFIMKKQCGVKCFVKLLRKLRFLIANSFKVVYFTDS